MTPLFVWIPPLSLNCRSQSQNPLDMRSGSPMAAGSRMLRKAPPGSSSPMSHRRVTSSSPGPLAVPRSTNSPNASPKPSLSAPDCR